VEATVAQRGGEDLGAPFGCLMAGFQVSRACPWLSTTQYCLVFGQVAQPKPQHRPQTNHICGDGRCNTWLVVVDVVGLGDVVDLGYMVG
jgi:hypothetical protein